MTAQPTPPATREQKLALLHVAIHRAQPDRIWYSRECTTCGKVMSLIEDCDCESSVVAITALPARLADVLLACHSVAERHITVDTNGGVYAVHPKDESDVIVGRWDLSDDNLSHQSDECLSFLFDLLGND